MSKIICSLLATLLLILVGPAISNAVLPTNFQRIIDAPVTNIEPYGKLNSILNILSDGYENYSAEERKEFFDSLKGKYVQWTLPVSDINTTYEGKVMVEAGNNDTPLIMILISPKDKSDLEYLSNFKEGDELKFKGRIDDYIEEIATIMISPAMIVSH